MARRQAKVKIKPKSEKKAKVLTARPMAGSVMGGVAGKNLPLQKRADGQIDTVQPPQDLVSVLRPSFNDLVHELIFGKKNRK